MEGPGLCIENVWDMVTGGAGMSGGKRGVVRLSPFNSLSLVRPRQWVSMVGRARPGEVSGCGGTAGQRDNRGGLMFGGRRPYLAAYASYRRLECGTGRGRGNEIIWSREEAT